MELKALVRRFSHGMEPWAFLPAAAVMVAFGAMLTDSAQTLFNGLQASIAETGTCYGSHCFPDYYL